MFRGIESVKDNPAFIRLARPVLPTGAPISGACSKGSR